MERQKNGEERIIWGSQGVESEGVKKGIVRKGKQCFCPRSPIRIRLLEKDDQPLVITW